MATTLFETLLKTRLSVAELETLHHELGYPSTHKLTRLMNNPGSATNLDVLKFQSVLDMDGYTLFMQYGLGKDTLDKLEVEQLRKEFAG